MNNSVRHILLDIEGTTCPVSFVSEVLFPYAGREVGAYLRRHGHENDIQDLLDELRASWEQEDDSEARALLRESSTADEAAKRRLGEQSDSDPAAQVTTLLPYIAWLIRSDRKVTAWKDLQGRIWREGYERGELRASLFSEVSQTLQRWKQAGFHLSVYSSGSVEAQKLLYGYSEAGDLRPLFSHWFDTRIGSKQDADSYKAIAEVFNCKPAEVLFISDSPSELTAARIAGFQVVFSDREENPKRDAEGFTRVARLDDLAIASPSV